MSEIGAGKYGYLTLLSSPDPDEGRERSLFRCVCGKEVRRHIKPLLGKRANPPSCGCKIKRYSRGKPVPTEAFSQMAQDFYLGV